ncbi:21529_t:CDS:2 [Rhizophagus irregularis]|nr:21529_t:CDS:2 [Rhizophagus irregularis]
MEETQRLKFLELKQKDTEQNLIKLETIAEAYYQSSQNELEEK